MSPIPLDFVSLELLILRQSAVQDDTKGNVVCKGIKVCKQTVRNAQEISCIEAFLAQD